MVEYVSCHERDGRWPWDRMGEEMRPLKGRIRDAGRGYEIGWVRGSDRLMGLSEVELCLTIMIRF